MKTMLQRIPGSQSLDGVFSEDLDEDRGEDLDEHRDEDSDEDLDNDLIRFWHSSRRCR